MKKIKDVIRITGLSRRTLQYYDDLGIVKATRTKDNYRLYGKEELWKLWRLLIYKEMGFQLDEIKEMLNQDEQSAAWRLEKRMQELEKEIDDLKRERCFVQKVLEYGIPDEAFVNRISKVTSYKDMASHLSGRM